MKVLRVKNFEKFQHYKDRNPPWIKFYVSLLDDYDFLQLAESQQRHLLFLWQLAAKLGNAIPYDAAYIRQAIKAKSKVDLPALIEAGFLIPVEHNASALLADRQHNASKDASKMLRTTRADARSREAEAETETETEDISAAASAREADDSLDALIAGFPQLHRSPGEREIVRQFAALLHHPTGYLATAAAMLDGIHGVNYTLDEIHAAMADWTLNREQRQSVQVFRRYVGNARKGKQKPAGRSARDKISRGLENLKNFAAEEVASGQ